MGMDYALINQPIVTLYGKPQLDQLTLEKQTSTIQDEGLYGMPVKILERCNKDWVKIETHYRYEGYVSISSLMLLNTEEWEKWQNSKRQLRVIIKNFADVLACPKVQGIRLMTLTRGAMVKVIERCSQTEGWVKIQFNDNKEGYMKESVLAPYYEAPCCQREYDFRRQVIETALTYLGTQYRWGGKSPFGIDCSGLTSMAYLINGVIIYRDAKIKEGFPIHEIAFTEKKPGDLLYFPGHIALYMGGDKYIHATACPGSDGVVINSLNPDDLDYRVDLAKSLYATGSLF